MQVSNANRRSITLPLGISEGEAPLAELKQLAGGLELVVPDDYEQLVCSNELSGEVFAIQRLLAISRLEIQITVLWGLAISQRLPEITRLQPLLAVSLMLQGVSHRLSGLELPHAEQVLTAAQAIA